MLLGAGSSVPSSHVDFPQILLCLATCASEAFAASAVPGPFGVLNRLAHPNDGLCFSFLWSAKLADAGTFAF